MVTLLGTLLGFLGSAFPDFIKIFKDRQDRRHELDIMDRQMELTKLGHTQRLSEVQISSEATEARALYHHAKMTKIAWVDALAGTVRPVVTYAFFGLYALVKVAQWHVIFHVSQEPSWLEVIVHLWQAEDQALFAAVMSFWFGHRALQRLGRK